MMYLLAFLSLAAPTLEQEREHVLQGYKPEEILDLNRRLNSYPSIRITLPSATGSGHQTANLNAIQRLRTLGYQGLIEVIYLPEDHLPLLEAHFQTEITDPGVVPGLRFLPHLVVLPPAPFVLSAANDEVVELGTRATVEYQPWMWGFPGQITLDGHKEIGPLLPKSGNKVTADPEVEDPTLRKLLNMGHEFDVMAVYPSVHGAKIPSIQVEVEWARMKRPELFPKTPLLLVMGDRRSCPPETCLDIRSPTLFANIAQARKKGRPAIVGVGRVPPSTAQAIYKASDLPPVVFGLNSMDNVLSESKPFLSISNWEYPRIISRIADDVQPSLHTPTLKAIKDNLTPKNTEQWLADFLIEAQEPDSHLREVFRIAGEQHRLGDRSIDALLAWARFDQRENGPPTTPATPCLEAFLKGVSAL